MSESELRRAVEACVQTLVHRGRPHMAQRLSAQTDRLLGLGETRRVHALLALFDPPRAPLGR